jgi:putative flavoprotein involved in K+ transport
MVEKVDTIVIGGGQAGLSVSWHLTKSHREHLLLDRGNVGDTWRHRWDSFCLVTPNRFCRLPGFPYNGDDPDGFMKRDEIVAYVEAFADSFNPPLRNGIEVHRVTTADNGDRFRIETSAGDFDPANVIIATGTHQHPKIPSWSSKLSDQIVQLHTSAYLNPRQLPEGSVLVVGSGQSGCQVVEDLRHAGRDVYLCVGKAGRIPRRYRGKDIIQWVFDAGFMDLPVADHPLGPAVRFEPHEHLTGRDGGRTIDLRQMAIDGVKLLGHMIDADGFQARFANDLQESLDAIDNECRETLALVDKYIAENGIEAPQNDIEPVRWRPTSALETVDLEQSGVSSVIYATGFTYDFSWIDLPIFGERGYPRYQRGITELPGFYFVGLHWMHTAGSGLFSQLGRDAEYVVQHMNRHRTSS